MSVSYYILLVLAPVMNSVVAVDYQSDPDDQYAYTCNTVSGNVCMAWTCPYYRIKNACCPGSREVSLPNGEKKSLADVSVGDLVLVGNGEYEPVLDFLHSERDSAMEYLRVSTRNASRPLLISP